MILVTGGLGFIGSHVARALLGLGESCLLTRHSAAPRDVPPGAVAERLDMADRDAFLALGDRYDVTGIVHLASTPLRGTDVVAEMRANTSGLLNAFEAARAWGVRRVCVASTIGVYAGVRDSPFREDAPLPPGVPHPIPAFKRSAEALASAIAGHAEFEAVCLRIGAVWGPRGRADSPFFAIPGLVNAAVRGEPYPKKVYSGDGIDALYAPDCGRAVALLQTAGTLRHAVYNIGSGHVTTNAQVATAIRKALPDAPLDLIEGRAPDAPDEDYRLDVTRLRDDTGFTPVHDLDDAVADYVAWLGGRAEGSPDH
ncbi:NAD-dependent epimerase/dehydratase family protein [Actinomadura verrucosospora]|uniref:NAD-dependent epimerase/dehydratase n=1 Tax=Actinomadura verrucosospora TaxID=46165 RepID=A0A7D3VX62_ACTVE|nr:NAD(P)-dependent oxidoreductase [Actinomadura verrucosospora]QKG25955.1 NAD-dependent epimerase/dehydratase [Actinomadura verrucosospora]